MRDYTKIEGSYRDIGAFIKNMYDNYGIHNFFNPEAMFNVISTDDQVTTQLQKDVGRTRLISIDEDYKDFESKCFDCKHQKGGFIQGAFSGAVFSENVFMPIHMKYSENKKTYENNICKFIYQGDDRDGFGFSACFFNSLNKKQLAVTCVNDFKKNDSEKSAVFILVNDITSLKLINNLKQEIENNIKSNVIKEWLILELFNIDGSFNEAGVGNINKFLLNNSQNNVSVRLNNSILMARIKELSLNFTLKEGIAEMESGPSYLSYFSGIATSYVPSLMDNGSSYFSYFGDIARGYMPSLLWSSDCKNSDKKEDSKQSVNSQISLQAITPEQVIGDTAAIMVVSEILNHNQESSVEDLEKIKETIKGF